MQAGSFLPQSRLFRVLAIVAFVIVVLLTALTVVLQRHNDAPTGHTDLITLAAAAADGPPESTEGVLISHLEMTGTTTKTTGISVFLTDMKGRPLPINGDYAVRLAALNLNTGQAVDARDLTADTTATTPTFTLDDPGLQDDGWWRFTTTITRPDGDPVVADFHVILPDPNLAGFDAPPDPDDDPEAARELADALDQISTWTSLRRWEWISGGNDSLILSNLAITTTAANGQPDAFQQDMLFAGGFERRDGGAPPPVPSTNHYTSVTIGEQGWSRNAAGEVQESSPTRYLPIHRYPETYEGATSIQRGITEEVDGRPAHIITFHVPQHPTRAQAWFAFWIDDETGDILKLTMIATNHYMIWVFSDVNADFVIAPPEGATPSATPPATPMS